MFEETTIKNDGSFIDEGVSPVIDDFEMVPITNDELDKVATAGDTFYDWKDEWTIIDELVFIYQKQFLENATKEDKIEAEKASVKLIDTFYPFFKKYLTLLKTGQINFKNMEQRLFVYLFIDDIKLKSALASKKELDRNVRAAIYQKFNFIKETYGYNDEEDIMVDLHMLFFTLAKRYKKMERSFCCYVYNVFRYEVCRHIEKFTRNPLNIHYRNISYEGLDTWTFNALSQYCLEYAEDLDESMATTESGLPDLSWICGINCSTAFEKLTPFQRKILSKYYLEEYNDGQLAKEFGLHNNTCNIKRHQALDILCKELGFTKKDIVRTRNSSFKKSKNDGKK